MRANMVVDVGNTRIKWGRVYKDLVKDWIALPHDDPLAWQKQIAEWKVASKATWLVAGVNPERRDALVKWLRERSCQVTQLESYRQIPIKVAVNQPERVGIDRLCNAVAANKHREADRPAIMIGVGSAVTVDLIDEEGTFKGGAILPGCTMMARALHTFTAKLPFVELPPNSEQLPFAPGKDTSAAIQLGIFWSVIGGIVCLIAEMAQNCQWRVFPQIFLTGGDAELLEPELSILIGGIRAPHCLMPVGEAIRLWPSMTLEGIRLAGEALP